MGLGPPLAGLMAIFLLSPVLFVLSKNRVSLPLKKRFFAFGEFLAQGQANQVTFCSISATNYGEIHMGNIFRRLFKSQPIEVVDVDVEVQYQPTPEPEEMLESAALGE